MLLMYGYVITETNYDIIAKKNVIIPLVEHGMVHTGACIMYNVSISKMKSIIGHVP